jgi:AbiA family abortive infection protein
MKIYRHSQIGYFLSFDIWDDALNLLNFQISQRQSNRHYNTLSIFHYEQTFKDCILDHRNEYFETKVGSSLFYGLTEEFFVYHYVIPKKGLGLRDYVFFTYPSRALYYAIGLYLLKLSEEFLLEVHGKLANVQAFYAGKLQYKQDKLVINKTNTYYRSYYDQFTKELEIEIKNAKENKVIIKLDIENYFSEISISILLEKLEKFIKPSIKSRLKFDIFTKDQIRTFFDFLMNKKIGIPQSENNIISSFIGYLFMSIGDFLVDDLLKSHCHIINEYKIIRYVDDIHISIVFHESIGSKQQEEFTLYIASEIAETLYRELNLRLNLKTRAYHLNVEQDEKELISRIKTLVSQDHAGFDYDEYQNSDEYINNVNIASDETSSNKNPQEKLDKIFEELEKLKNSNVESYFIRSNVSLVSDEAFREIFDKSVYAIILKPENLKRMKEIFNDFNFDLIKVKPFEITILILRDDEISSKFRKFLIRKKSITSGDADLIIKYLCQKNFNDSELFEKLSENSLLTDIIQLIQDKNSRCRVPGYYKLSCISIRKISEMPEVIEQMRMRIFNEKSQSYSVALNHLLNEIQAICIRKENVDKKSYDSNRVFQYLLLMSIPHDTRIKILNLFDRRNNNGVSHPGSDDGIAWEVSKEEYFDYHRHVGICLDHLLCF